MLGSDNKSTKMSFQSKLRLKRNNSDSSENTVTTNIKNYSNSNANIQESCSSNQLSQKASTCSLPNAEDSLVDFKSPKKEVEYGSILNKFKIDAEKPKKKILKSKSKSSSKSRKSSLDIKQPSIESTFFKPQTCNQNEIKESIPCPLCLKPFKDDIACTNHMKTCASRHNVSTKQLFEAKQLQDRQAAERKSLGLLAAPVLPERKKVFRSKNFSTGDDPQLELVLAMSESLYQAEQMEEFEKAALLAGVPSECIKDMNDEQRRITLQNFGFTTNKPVSEISTNKSKKKKLVAPTILQTRTKEDKDRVLTERIACILTGDDALTQVQQRPEIISEQNTPAVLKSKVLKKIEKSYNRLWDSSRLTKKYIDFYVEELKTHFLKSKEQTQDTGFRTCEPLHENVDGNEKSISLDTSILYEPMDIDIVIDEDKEQNNSHLSSINESSISKSESMNSEQCFVKNVISNWGATLNDSAASDIIIFVKNNKHIYAHKLVFHVQCSNILLNIEPNNNDKYPKIENKLCWLEKDQLSALAFLEFVYCGIIKRYINVFNDDNLMSQVRQLARLYKVKDLFTYLRKKQNECTFKRQKELTNTIDVDPNFIDISTENCNNSNKEKNHSFNVQSIQNNSAIQKCHSDPTPVFKKLVADNNISNHLSMKNYNERRITASPDLFESEDEEVVYSDKAQANDQNEEKQSDKNLKSVHLIEKDRNNIAVLVLNIDEPQMSENCTEQHFNSQKTVINLSRTPSPCNDKSLSPFPEDIYEALTPKHRSPENDQKGVIDKIDIRNEQVTEVVTSKCGRSSERYKGTSHTKKKYDDNFQISEAVTPNNRSPEKSNTSEIEIDSENNHMFEAITPKKNRSPERGGDTSQENIDCENNQIFEAITPKYGRSPESISNQITKKINYSINEISEAVTPGINELRQISDSVPEETNEKDDDSMYTAVTPPKSDGKHFELSTDQNLQKLKKDLNSIINRVRKANAKGIFDTDSETDTPSIQVKPRYRFAKRLRDDSYAYLRNDGCSTKDSQRVISLLERDVLESEKKSNLNKVPSDSIDTSNNKLSQNGKELSSSATTLSNVNLSPDTQDEFMKTNKVVAEKSCASCSNEKSNFELTPNTILESSTNINKNRDVSTFDDDIQDITVNETEMSVYSKYKMVHKHDNSIAKYREKLNFCSKLNRSKERINFYYDKKHESSNTSNNVSKKEFLQINIVLQTKPTNIVDITLVSDSDNENENNSATATNFENIAEHQSTLQMKKKDVKSKSSDSALSNNIENDSTIPLGAIDDRFEQLRNSTALNEKSKNEVIDLSVDSDEEDIHDDSTFPYKIAAESDSSLKKIKYSKESSVSKDKQKELLDNSEKKTDDVDVEISKILQSSLEDHNKDEYVINNRENTNKKEKSNRDEANTLTQAKSDQHEVINLSPISIISSPENNQSQTDNRPESANLDKSKQKSKFKRHNNSKENTKLPLGGSKNLANLYPIEDECFDDIEFDDDCDFPQSGCQSVLDRSISKKKLIFDELSSKNTSSPVSPNHNHNVTPPKDYNALGSPELQKELKKFGLKPQSREKAKLLLQHIYNETHPVVSKSQKRACTNSSSEDEESTSQKKNLKKVCRTGRSEEKAGSYLRKSSPNCRDTIPEEMDFDELDTANGSENPVKIKDAFLRLIKTNKELHTKVLAYEPLPLESLHLMLKQSGFKCKINNLMDFLDEHCITFQVYGKGSHTKKKKNTT